MIIALTIIIVVMAAACCWFFAKRWDEERAENLRLRCEYETREEAMRAQLSAIMTEHATFLNTARVQLEVIHQRKKIPQLVPPVPRSFATPMPNGYARDDSNLVQFPEE